MKANNGKGNITSRDGWETLTKRLNNQVIN